MEDTCPTTLGEEVQHSSGPHILKDAVPGGGCRQELCWHGRPAQLSSPGRSFAAHGSQARWREPGCALLSGSASHPPSLAVRTSTQVTQPSLSQLPEVTHPWKSHQTLGNFTLKFSAYDCTLRLPERKRKLELKLLPKPHQPNTLPTAEIIIKSNCPV